MSRYLMSRSICFSNDKGPALQLYSMIQLQKAQLKVRNAKKYIFNNMELQSHLSYMSL